MGDYAVVGVRADSSSSVGNHQQPAGC